MPSPTFTQRRLYRRAHALLGFQGAQGTPVADFSTVLTRAMWIRQLTFDPQFQKDDDQGTTGTSQKREEARFTREILPIMTMFGGATPGNIEWLLRSWGGTWAGGPTLTLTLTEDINEFATLGLVERTPVPNTQQFLRVFDMWAHRVTLRVASGLSTLDVQADFAGRDFDRTQLDALGGAGITLPGSFNPPNLLVFAPHQVRLRRDPATLDVSIAVRELEIVFEHGLNHETWNDRAPQVVKDGPTSVRINLRGVWLDETLAMQTDAETLIATFQRFQAEFTSGASSFIVDLRNVDWIPSITGWQDNGFAEFTMRGEAYLDASSNYLNVTLTP